MEQSGFIVGIDLGTSKIVGLLARRNEQGVVSVLASETIPSDSSVRHGVVYNIEETAGKVKRLIQLLENKTGKKIAKAYFSIAGKSLESVAHTETVALPSDTAITIGMIDNLERKAKEYQPENYDTNYGVVSPQIFLDGEAVDDFEGKTASLLEGKFQIITGRPNIKHNIRVVAEKVGIEIAGLVIGPITASALILGQEEKKSGCALVDFGAGTTSLSIYKDGLLKFFKVIPFGGRTVTKDIQALGFVDSTAEDFKIRYGKIGKDRNKNIVEDRAGSGIDVKELNKVIQLRYEEIILNVINQIEESGCEDKLEGGLILTGGASQQNGLESFLAEKVKYTIKKASPNRVLINNVSDLVQNPAYSNSLSLLLFANVNCEKQETKTVQATTALEPVAEPPLPVQPTAQTQPVQTTQPAVAQPVAAPEPIKTPSVATVADPKPETPEKPAYETVEQLRKDDKPKEKKPSILDKFKKGLTGIFEHEE